MDKINLIKEALYSKEKERRKISIPSEENFGLEIEIENVDYDKTEKIVSHLKGNFKTYQDLSLKNKGIEVVTPVLHNTKEEMQYLKKLSKTLKHLNPTFDNCSFQINFDNNLTFEQLRNFFMLYCYYEKVIYNFSKGNDLFLRRQVDIYANLIYNDFSFEYAKYKNDPDLLFTRFTENKMFGLNLKEMGLIEFRTPNGTDDYELWLNYIQTFYSIIDCAKKENFEKTVLEDFMKNYVENLSNGYTLAFKEFPLNVDKTVEFAETIFKEDEDKVYFLKQCFNHRQEKVIKYLDNKNIR